MTKRIAILIDTVTSFERNLLIGIAHYAHLYGPWIFNKPPAPFMPHREGNRLLEELEKFNPDGIIMRECSFSEKILNMGRPTIVSPFREKNIAAGFRHAVTVLGDDPAIGAAAAEHLLDKGLRVFAYCGLDDMFWSSLRRDGFCQRLNLAGFTAMVYPRPKTKTKCFWENEKALVTQWLAALPKPVGLMCCIDHRSEQLAQVCLEQHIYIPEEIALIGVNNDQQVCELATPPLSSVALNDKQTGFATAELLDRMMQGEKLNPVHILTHPNYVAQRLSTDIIATDDSDVAEAVRFIRANLRKNIGIAEVTRAAAVPRRTLERKFQKYLHRTIHQAITHERIKLAEQFLVTTRLPIAQIAAQIGYSNNGELIRNFKKVKQTTPLAYRKQYALIS